MNRFKPSSSNHLFQLLLVTCATLLLGCTERNPAYCGDGTCTDPAKPYCDFNGDFGGMPGTCIAVTCNPGELAMCRGDSAIKCTSMGNNYETTQCSLGCDPAASGCKQCTANSQCMSGQLCDMGTFSCRGCKSDDECDSKVCDFSTSSCLAESDVLYAAPNGSGGSNGLCTQTQPCDLNKAVVTAANSPTKRIVRMLPGTYTASLKMNVLNQSVNVVATGATIFVLGDVAAVVVDGGSTLDVRGLNSNSERQVQCGLASTSAPMSSVTLHDVKFASPQSSTALEIQRCSLNISRGDFTGSGVTLLATRDDSRFVGDQLHMPDGGDPSSIIAAGSRSHIKLTNSLLEDTDIVVFFADTSGPGSTIELGYDTMFSSQGISVCAQGSSSYVTRRIENSIIAAGGTYDALQNANPGTCTFASTLLSHQSQSLSGATVADPQFVNASGSDFHLKATSRAVDAATAGTISSAHDLEGTARPVGGASDLGAYERHP